MLATLVLLWMPIAIAPTPGREMGSVVKGWRGPTLMVGVWLSTYHTNLLLSLPCIHRGCLSWLESILHHLRASRRPLLRSLVHHNRSAPARTWISLRTGRGRRRCALEIGMRLLGRVHMWMMDELSCWIWYRLVALYHHWPSSGSSPKARTIVTICRPTWPARNSILRLLMRRIHGPDLGVVGDRRLLVRSHRCAV